MARIGEGAVVVVGLGRFGESVARNLMAAGTEVLVIDKDPDLVAEISSEVTLAVEADGSSRTVLRELGVEQCAAAVVGIGEGIEASIVATSNLSDLGVPEIWARATSSLHGRILERVGATRIVYPEREMGHRVALAMLGEEAPEPGEQV